MASETQDRAVWLLLHTNYLGTAAKNHVTHSNYVRAAGGNAQLTIEDLADRKGAAGQAEESLATEILSFCINPALSSQAG